ncbi:MAG TPA: hypothetical protein VMV45_18525 [Casimicrobiaceae bacterium]|nr:hypothetical protein [Casimicrobiaceae bacterium]
MQFIASIATLPDHELHAALRDIPLPAFEAAMRGHAAASRKARLRHSSGFDIANFDDITVSLAVSDEDLEVADELVRVQYDARGYFQTREQSHAASRRRALPVIAWLDGRPMGTATLGIDSEAGLMVDEANRRYVDLSRAYRRRAGEVVRLATADRSGAKLVLPALFGALHTMMVIHDLVDVFIEVNPRHVSFYERALCFAVAGPEQICPRVGAPSVLLRMRVADLTHKIRTLQHEVAEFPLH